jgi:hypothetical protein
MSELGGSSWGGNTPVTSEVTVQSKGEKREKEERQHIWVVRPRGQQRAQGLQKKKQERKEGAPGTIKGLD